MEIEIPPLKTARLKTVFSEEKDSPFGTIDSNLAAWLPESLPSSDGKTCTFSEFEIHQDNQEVIQLLGGEKQIKAQHLFTPQQIRHLASIDVSLQKNGFSNLFFVLGKEGTVYIVGVVWDKTIEKFAPYVYRTRNLYRSWSKGNRLFYGT